MMKTILSGITLHMKTGSKTLWESNMGAEAVSLGISADLFFLVSLDNGRIGKCQLCETPAFAISISHSIHRGHKVRAAEICQQISIRQNYSKTLEVNLHGTRNALVGFPQKIGPSHVQAQHFFTRHI
jgi:hypothetical protein